MSEFTLQPIPYISFNGNCAEALDFYATVLGGKIVGKMTYGEMPVDPHNECVLPDEFKSRIVNEMLELPGGAVLYGGDARPEFTYTQISGISLALNFPTVEQAQIVFEKFADGGAVIMPFAPAFWSEKFGMVTDKYGVDWLINGNLGVRT